MPIDWSEGIILAALSGEPELSEELSAIFDRVRSHPGAAGADEGQKGKGGGGGGRDNQDAGPPHVVLNFEGVAYLNSSHIAALLRLRKKLLESDRALVLCSLSDELWTMILLTGLDKVFQFAPDTMTALARVQLDAGGAGQS